jgi:hypothetical protein
MGLPPGDGPFVEGPASRPSEAARTMCQILSGKIDYDPSILAQA